MEKLRIHKFKGKFVQIKQTYTNDSLDGKRIHRGYTSSQYEIKSIPFIIEELKRIQSSMVVEDKTTGETNE